LDEATGQIRAVFDNSPQTPFTRFEMKLNGGPRAILRNPADCGQHTMTSDFTPWSGGPDANPSADFTTSFDGSGALCPAEKPFAPKLVSASSDPTTAGAATKSKLVIERGDGDQPLKKLDLSLPEGLIGSLASVPLCPAEVAQAGDCSDESRVGHVRAAVGTGSVPLELPGSLYLSEPTEPGDVAAIAAVIPAKVGPIDLGKAVVINRVLLRPSDSGVDVSADLPTIFGGVPLALRRIEIDVDREGFLQNPTGCDERTFSATFTSGDDPTTSEVEAETTATTSVPSQATGCDKLPFSPRLRMIAGAPGLTAKGSHPPLRAIVTQDQGEAAIASTRVALPDVLRPNLPQLQKEGGLCQEAQLVIRACPAASQVGSAIARSPLLANALSGPVYIVQHPGNPLPKLAVLLSGQASLDLSAQNAIEGIRTVNTFSNVPDVPLTSFELSINGGPSGILNAFDNLCKSPAHADATFTAHNGKAMSSAPALEVEGCPRVAPASISSLSRVVRMTRRGVVRVAVNCASRADCDGALTLDGQVSVSAKRKTRRRTLGKKRFSIAAGTTRTVKVKLSRAARRTVLRRKRLRARATAAVGGAKATRTITIVAPR
ncbi:MAG: hypothetical protein WD336_09680, partial [Trueperaceae bacterium]